MNRGKWFATWGVLIVLGIAVFGVGFIGYSQNEIQLAPGQNIKAFNCEGSQNKQCNLDIKDKISGFSITGELTLSSDKSIVRAILVDKSEKEYLIYEAYPLISGTGKIKLSDACEETCILPGISPFYIKLQVSGANIKINKIRYDSSAAPRDVSTRATDLKRSKDNEKIKKINSAIKSKGMRWTAGETSVSRMTYAQKKRLFTYPNGTQLSELPDLQGFEYYKGGVFELSGSEASSRDVSETTINPSLPSSWDWRNVHGENWMTPVKDQGQVGNCWAFASIGALESQINLYYNQHINVDLSEQILVDCENSGPISELISELTPLHNGCYDNLYSENGPSYPGSFDGYCAADKRRVDESCDVYAQRDVSFREGELMSTACSYKYVCSDWQNRVWGVSDFHDYIFDNNYDMNSSKQTLNLSEDEFKKILITKGPMSSGITSWAHAMVLVGYQNYSSKYTFENPFGTEATAWIFKNSWGENWGENGYAKVILSSIEDFGWGSLPIGPFVPPIGQSYQVNCVDKDNDGYCNWGISENKPSTCPSSCKAEKDFDDSNSKISFNNIVTPVCGNGILETGELCETGITVLKSCAAGDSIQESCTNCQISAISCSAPSTICRKPAYYAMVRCYNANTQDHMTVIGDMSTCSIFPGYASERILGYVPKSEPGAVSPISRKGSSQTSSSGMISFYRCTVNGNSDSFSSFTSNCEGQRKDIAEYISVFNSKDVYSWSTPKLITRCVIPSTGEHFDSEVVDANGNPTCEASGYTPEGTRWYVWATPPSC